MTGKLKTILLFGPPGCGKGTQGKTLGTLPGFRHVSSGDLFRALDRASELGKIFTEYSSKGLLVPDDFTVRLWRDHMDKLIAAGKLDAAADVVILDGIPRNVRQAEMLQENVAVQKIVVMSIERDAEYVVQRLKLRAQKENRADDAKVEVIRRRMDVYQNETAPMLAFYPKDVQVTVDAIQTPLEVAHDILSGVLGRTQELHPIR